MNHSVFRTRQKTLGIIGFGAFGQLAARHLQEHFQVAVYDPQKTRAEIARGMDVTFASLDSVSQSDVVLIAAPVNRFEAVIREVAAVCKPGALIIDVGSVKVKPAEIMDRLLPNHVDIVATHPLFGPQSGQDGIKGLKIAVCPLRGLNVSRVAEFLKHSLGLQVIRTTPEEHDKEVAVVQGLTHLIAKVLIDMGPLPTRMTTKSFDLLSEAISMVQHDAPEVFEAIEHANPFSEDVRRRFFEQAAETSLQFEAMGKANDHGSPESPLYESPTT